MERLFASPLTMVRAGQASFGARLPSISASLGFQRQAGDGFGHRPHGGCENVVAIDTVDVADADADGLGMFQDEAEQALAIFLFEGFAVVDALGNMLGIENDGCGNDGTGPGAASGLIDPCNGAFPRASSAASSSNVGIMRESSSLMGPMLAAGHGLCKEAGGPRCGGAAAQISAARVALRYVTVAAAGSALSGPGPQRPRASWPPSGTGGLKRSVLGRVRRSLRPVRFSAKRKRSAICCA